MNRQISWKLKIGRAISNSIPSVGLPYASIRARLSRYPLPPGELVTIHQRELTNRRYLLEQASRIGPIFKGTDWGHLRVCLIGLPLCRRFLNEHGAHLKSATIRLNGLVPKGFLRQMEGEDHRRYRSSLMNVISVPEIDSQSQRAIASEAFARYAATDDVSEPETLSGILSDIASGMLIHTFFGASLGTSTYDELMNAFQSLGPNGFVWNISKSQADAFSQILAILREEISRQRAQPSMDFQQSILGRLVANGTLDDTLFGNAIYMVEMARSDMAGYFRWLVKYCVDYPAYFERLASESMSANSDRPFAEAFAMETLRSDKSEQLLRVAKRDLVFEGYLIPRFTRVRLCLWESHQSSPAFESSREFNPERFLNHNYSADEFAPFGLGHHRCPFGGVAIRMCVIFLDILASRYALEPITDGPPILGLNGSNLWLPAPDFTARLVKQ